MPPEPVAPRAGDPWVQTAVLLWIAVLAVICIRVAIYPHKRTLYTTWAQAGSDWENGRDLYRNTWEADQDQFRYSPLVAVLLVPFHHLSLRLGGVMWRLLNAAVLLGGFAWWLRTAPVRRTTRQQGILFLLMLPLSLGSLNNGQPNPLVIGLLLAALAALERERWSLAAGLVALATAWKVYPLAVGLLLAAVYPRRFAPRLLLALVLAFLLPFVCQHGEYVRGQYASWSHRLGVDQRHDWPLHMAYRDLWLLIRVLHLPLTPRVYLGIQLTSAAGCAILCVAARLRGLPRRKVLGLILALGSCWMMLCGPATESSTYVLLAPALSWAVLSAFGDRWPWPLRMLVGSSFVLLLLSVLAGVHPSVKEFHALGMHPLGALLLTVAYVAMAVRALTAIRPAFSNGAAEPPARAA
jgi:hypothetical protein